MGAHPGIEPLLAQPYRQVIDEVRAIIPGFEGSAHDKMMRLAWMAQGDAITLEKAYSWAISRIGPGYDVAEFGSGYEGPPEPTYGGTEIVEESWKLQQETHPELQPGYIAPIPSTEPTPGDVTKPEVITIPTGPGPAPVVDHYEVFGDTVGPSQAPEIPWLWIAIGAVGLLTLAKR